MVKYTMGRKTGNVVSGNLLVAKNIAGRKTGNAVSGNLVG
jgi:hypothetical protein